MQLGLESNVIILDSESTMKEDMVEEEDGQSSLTDHEIDVEDIDDGDDGHPGMGKSSSVVHRHRHHQQGSHSNVRSFKEEEDEDEELDKEDVVDEEDETPLGAVKSKKKSGKKSGKSSGSGSSGSSSNSNPQIKPKCNCDQLRLVDCHLETKELWDKFNELGTEMIITKTGRSDSLIFSDQSTTKKVVYRVGNCSTVLTNRSPYDVVSVKVIVTAGHAAIFVSFQQFPLALIIIFDSFGLFSFTSSKLTVEILDITKSLGCLIFYTLHVTGLLRSMGWMGNYHIRWINISARKQNNNKNEKIPRGV